MLNSQIIQEDDNKSKNDIFCNINGLKKKIKLNKKEIEDNFREITRVSYKFKRLSEDKFSFHCRFFENPTDSYYSMYSIEFDDINKEIIVEVIYKEKRISTITKIAYRKMLTLNFDKLYELIYNKCDDIHNFCIGRTKKIKSRADEECEDFMIDNGYMKKYNPDNFDVLKGVRAAINNSLRN